jgi:hypothetical protein
MLEMQKLQTLAVIPVMMTTGNAWGRHDVELVLLSQLVSLGEQHLQALGGAKNLLTA